MTNQDRKSRLTNAAADVAALLKRVASVSGAAWIVNAETGEIAASNATATQKLEGATARSTRDKSLLVQLRALARSALAGHLPTDPVLTFPTNCGQSTVRCVVRALDNAPDRLVLVTELAPEVDDLYAKKLSPVRGPPTTTSHDTTTLRLIARQIRQGGNKPAGLLPASRNITAPEAGAAVLAHELKTPLSAIVAATEIMRDERLGPIANERYRSYVLDIHDSAQHALRVLDQLLEKSADIPRRAELTFTDVDIEHVIGQTTSALRPLAERARVNFTDDRASGLPRVIADQTSLKQILINLLSNAIKYTDAGGSIVVVAHYDRGAALVITVTDTGRGMSPEILARTAATPAHPGVENVFAPGSGTIGLPLVRVLAAANGADFTIESTLGKGTSARLSFPKDRIVPV